VTPDAAPSGMLRRLGSMLTRRSVGMTAGLVGAAAGYEYLTYRSSFAEPQPDETQQPKRSLAEFRRAPPLRTGSMNQALKRESSAPVSEERPVFVGIAGGTGSGKTTVAESISRRLQGHGDRVTHICHDNYYKPLDHMPLEERAKTNFDHPDSLDTALMVSQLKELQAGRSVCIPTYDFATHCRGAETVEKAPARVVIVEGILIFSTRSCVSSLTSKFSSTPMRMCASSVA